MNPMSEITIPETAITPEGYNTQIRQLSASVLLQAVRDYCRAPSETHRITILNELRSPYMDFLSNGMATVVADQLEKNYEAIKARLAYEEEE